MQRRVWSSAVAIVVVLMACVGGLVTSAQSPSAPGAVVPPAAVPSAAVPPSPVASVSTGDPLIAGLLQAVDLPAGMQPATAIQEGTDYDIDDAAFMANNGARIVSRTWGMEQTDGPSIVFDFRMQFGTPDEAAAYLAAAMPTLSETATSGLAPLTEVPALGDETYGFGRDTQGNTGPVSIRAYLFRVGSVVAKVVAGGGAISGEEAQAIAQAAAARVAAAGQPAPGSPRPAPTPTPVPSLAVPLPSGDLSGLLLAHIPTAFQSTCVSDSQRLWEGELVTLVCKPTDSDVTVTYSGFDTHDHMGAAYQSSLDGIDLSSLADGCDTGTWTGANVEDGQTIGQTTCWSEQNGRAIMWSDDGLSVLSVAVSPTLDAAGLYQWWLGAGPTP